MTAIVVDGLRKAYGAVEAVRGVSFTVEEGEVFGLLGPNGAGKTTTIEILEGYRHRDAGSVTVLGVDPQSGGRKLRERVGLVLQEAAVPPMLSVKELVELYRGFYPSPRPADEIIELVGLTEKAGERVRKLSGGQQRRLDVALGLVGDPELIFLDEPTTGFDPSARRAAWEVVRNMRTLGKTIVLTTHYMDEAQYLADRICVIASGKVVAEGTPETLRARTERRTHIRFELPAGVDVAKVPIPLTVSNGMALIETSTPTRSLCDLTTWAVAQGIELPNLEVNRPSLEDVYLELTDHDVAAQGDRTGVGAHE
ncbi:MAG TPA: ABC transporter ATP-binding protein [Candidatus Acidoferrales bacterium]|nr:ABC transporter ATP-binding protein [Candidatus Acidoferrales bacterium]